MRKVPNLSISPEKAFFIITKARQSDSKAVESDLVTDLSDDDASFGLTDLSKDTDRSELSGFIRGLNVDEQIDLVALMWLGRGGGKSSFACHIAPLFIVAWGSMIAPAKAKSWQSPQVDRAAAAVSGLPLP